MTAGRWKRRLLVVGIVAAWVGLTYWMDLGFWVSAAATALVLLFGRLAFGREWLRRLGLAWRPGSVRFFLAGLLPTFVLATVLVPAFAARAGLESSFSLADVGVGWIVYSVFQTLVEELVLGGLLLFTLSRRWPGRPARLSVGVAAVFALLHVALYASPHQAWFGGTPRWLALPTVLSLFSVGVLRNHAILGVGDVSLAWGIHLGFNLPLFRSDVAPPVAEAVRMDAILGDPWMLAITAAAALASFLLLLRRRPG